MKLKFKLLPAIMTVLSVLYLIYVISSESTTLVADAVGGDPGGKLLPSIIAVFLIVGFLFMTLKERPTGEKMDRKTFSLFLVTLVLAILYVVLTKSVGFILLTTVILYSLEYLFTTVDEKRKPVSAVIGGIITLALTTGFYTLMRLFSKNLTRMGKAGTIPAFLGKRTSIAVICLAYVAILVTLFSLTLVRFLGKKGYERESKAGVITFAVTMFLFVVFKQFFLVALAPGLLNF